MAGTVPSERAVAPHPTLHGYYETPGDRVGFVRELFDGTAPHYDRINSAFSLGTGAWYRRRTLRRAGLRRGDRVLDVAVGTGLVAREAVGIVGGTGLVVGLDLSAGMLAQARRAGLRAPLVQAMAENIPLAADSADFLSMGYALRHVADLGAAFREYRRVLRPGGTVLLLEIGRPDGRLAYAAARAYLGTVVPALCRLTTPRGRTGTLMRYYWDTIDNCVPADAILGALRAAGFADVRLETALGIFRAFVARRPGGEVGGSHGEPGADDAGASDVDRATDAIEPGTARTDAADHTVPGPGDAAPGGREARS